MESVNYVARAKRLLQQTARTAALVIIPLAAAVSAQAGPTLPTSVFTCSSSWASCGAGAGAVQLAEQNGVTGTKLYSNGFVQIFQASGGLSARAVAASNLTLSVSGSLTGGSLETGYGMPLFYDFTISGGGSLTGTTWSLLMQLSTFSGSVIGTFNASGSGTGFFSGSGALNIVSGGVVDGNPLVLTSQISVAPGAGVTNLFVDVPVNSTSFNSVVAAVPEPGSMGLLASALAAVGLVIRRRKTS